MRASPAAPSARLLLSGWRRGREPELVSIPPSAEDGLPFFCDWGYDWRERCYADRGLRLPIGGVDDKVRRSALRLPPSRISPDAVITSADLRVEHDGICVAPRPTSIACDAGGYRLDAHRILSADWFDEREPELDGRIKASAVLWDASARQTLAFDLTALVPAWHGRAVSDDGVLLSLVGWQEGYGASGPYVPSSSFPTASLRPQLVVAYTPAPG